MSIALDKLSLLGSLVPLRQKVVTTGIPDGIGFAEKLTSALGDGNSSDSDATGKARELAQSLTLQMLQSSLSLAGDSSSEKVSASASFTSAQAILRAYRSNLPTEEGPSLQGSSPKPQQSQLRDLTLTDGTVLSTSAVQAPWPHSGSEWLNPIISKASRKYGVDVGLIKAVIHAESDFNPHAVSHAGARGLMQLMPATARSLGVSDSFDPEQNVMAGTRFLKDMLQRYNGNVDSALAAYNWGPGNVDKRADHLPRETRDYLARVKQLYASYTG
jgi:soluble lytic murein transglycosylase-like protein